MHARDYFAGVSVPAIEKTSWCQLCLYTVSRMSACLTEQSVLVTCSSKHSCLQCLNNDVLLNQPLRSSQTMCTQEAAKCCSGWLACLKALHIKGLDFLNPSISVCLSYSALPQIKRTAPYRRNRFLASKIKFPRT